MGFPELAERFTRNLTLIQNAVNTKEDEALINVTMGSRLESTDNCRHD
jgi:hypothetical protein